MICVGGTNDRRNVPVRDGLRHGHIVEVPRLRSIDGIVLGDIPAMVDHNEIVERYRCFEFTVRGNQGKALVSADLSNQEAYDEILLRFERGDLGQVKT